MRRDRVVLVDDREDAQAEQSLHGAAGVRAVHRVLEVAGGEQHLPGDDAERAQRLLVAVDQDVLPDRGRRLLRREVARTLVEQQERHPGRDRAGRDEHDLGAARVRCGEGFDDRPDLLGVLAADRRRADLDDDPARGGDVAALERRHASSSSSQPVAARRSASSSARASALASMQLVVLLATLRRGAARVLQRGAGSVPRGAVMSSAAERERGLPVEDDAVALADHDGGARDRAGAEQLVLDAELLEPIGEVADGLLVLEVGLLHPAHRLLAEDPVDVAVGAAFDADREVLLRAPAGG